MSGGAVAGSGGPRRVRSLQRRQGTRAGPHPLVKLNAAGVPDLSDAYATGIGEWDKVAIAYAYQDYPPNTDVAKASDRLLRDATTRGLLFIADRDARPEGGAHPQAHLWDNGADAAAELNRILDVRAKALARFGERNIRTGDPMSNLEDVLVPVYLLHRYQTEAAAKVLGGVNYSYATRGDGQKIVGSVSVEAQRKALDALLRTISPAALAMPQHIVKLIPPTAFEYSRTREDFRSRTGLTFDPLGAAESAASLTVGLLLNPERAARLVQQPSPNLGETIDRLIGVTWNVAGPHSPLQQTIDSVVLYHLMTLAANANAPELVKAVAFSRLKSLRTWLEAKPVKDPLAQLAIARIRKFEQEPKEVSVPKPADPPPGQPIGCDWAP